LSHTDYGLHLDDEVQAYIARANQFSPANAAELNIKEQRAAYNRLCAAFHAGRPDNVTTWDEHLGGVPCRRYESGAHDTTLIYYHGGGFVVGGLDSHDDVCAELCAQTAVGKIFKPDLRRAAITRVFDQTLEAAGVTARVDHVVDDKKRGLVAVIAMNGAEKAAVGEALGAFANPWDAAA